MQGEQREEKGKEGDNERVEENEKTMGLGDLEHIKLR